MTLVTNKKATFDYEILETFEAGIKLTGQEVKSVKSKHIKIQGAYISVLKGTCLLKNCSIPKYSYAGNITYDPLRDRILLLSRKQIDQLAKKLDEKGIAVTPLEVYLKGNLIKIKIGVGRGKKKYDKRQIIKNRDLDRQMKRSIKNY